MKNVNWALHRARLKEAILVLPHFFRNPVQGMRQLPDWDWATILILQGVFAASGAIISHLLERELRRMFIGLLIAPIANYILLAILAGVFFYALMFLFEREVPFRQIYTHVLFAAIPSMIVSVVADLLPPLMILGAAASLMLLYVSFVENFHVDRLKAKKIFWGLMAIYALFWVIQVAQTTSRHEKLRIRATPESLDILENELKLGE
jgi:hypothetical protein